MSLQPVAALGQGLILGIHLCDLFGCGIGDQAMRDFQVDLRHDLQITFDKIIQRFPHAAFGGVLNRNHRVVGFAFFHCGE